jgi:hypothetical protein
VAAAVNKMALQLKLDDLAAMRPLVAARLRQHPSEG